MQATQGSMTGLSRKEKGAGSQACEPAVIQ